MQLRGRARGRSQPRARQDDVGGRGSASDHDADHHRGGSQQCDGTGPDRSAHLGPAAAVIPACRAAGAGEDLVEQAGAAVRPSRPGRRAGRAAAGRRRPKPRRERTGPVPALLARGTRRATAASHAATSARCPSIEASRRCARCDRDFTVPIGIASCWAIWAWVRPAKCWARTTSRSSAAACPGRSGSARPPRCTPSTAAA